MDLDEEGDADDWVELYNPSDQPLALGGFFLSDNVTDPTRWRIPFGTVIPAGRFIRIWCDEKPAWCERCDDGDEECVEILCCPDRLHANFALDPSQDWGLFLFESVLNDFALIDHIDFRDFTEPCRFLAGVSVGRCPGGEIRPLEFPTPGEPNSRCGDHPPLGAPGNLRVMTASTGSVAFEWDPAEGASSYEIERGVGDLHFVPLVVLRRGPETRELPTSYEDRAVTRDRSYRYRVRAVSGACVSGWVPAAEGLRFVPFRRGDLDGDGKAGLPDVVMVLRYTFDPVKPAIACVKAADVDDSGKVGLRDALQLLVFVFAEGQPPAPPFPELGFDPTPDVLPCVRGTGPSKSSPMGGLPKL